ncbi:Processive diacylglycerol beta-glucosyltransferase [subsurface metagenome]
MVNENPSKKVLVPYILTGYGHFIIAQAIALYLKKKQPDWDVRLFELASEFKDQALERFYKRAWRYILQMPTLAAQVVFGVEEALPALSSFVNGQLIHSAVLKAMGFLAGYKPDLIMSTHWGCTHIFNQARNKVEYEVPLWYVYTELAGGYQLMNCGADKYFVMSDEADKALKGEGIAAEKMEKINLVVRPQFAEQIISKENARRDLGLPVDDFILLFSVGGEGIGPTFGFINAFIKTVKQGRILVATGRNEKLFDGLQAKFKDKRVTPLGFREDIERLMAASDVMAGKCGASYSMEAAIMRRPFIVTSIGAPSERPNMKYIVENGFGWYTSTPAQFAKLLETFVTDKIVYQDAIDNLNKVSRINGAETVAADIVDSFKH